MILQGKHEDEQKAQTEISTLNMAIPTYEQLSEEEKEKVDAYISMFDSSNPLTLNQISQEAGEALYEESSILIGMTKTNSERIREIFARLIEVVEEEKPPQPKGIIGLVRRIVNKPKTIPANKRLTRARVISTVDINDIKEALEEIGLELEINAGKLEQMAQNSAKQYRDTQYQIIALQEILKNVRENAKANETRETTRIEGIFEKTNRDLMQSGMIARIEGRIRDLQCVFTHAAANVQMSKVLAANYLNLASNYRQSTTNLIAEIQQLVLISEVTTSLQDHDSASDTINTWLTKEYSSTMRELGKMVSQFSNNLNGELINQAIASAKDEETDR